MLKVELDWKQLTLNQPGTVRNVVAEFSRTRITDLETSKILLKEIEGSDLCDDGLTVIDKFGYKITRANICTGARAALLVANRPDLRVSMLEAGYNAIEAIIKWCRNGNIVICRQMSFAFGGKFECSVEYNGMVFTDTKAFNDHWRGADIL